MPSTFLNNLEERHEDFISNIKQKHNSFPSNSKHTVTRPM